MIRTKILLLVLCVCATFRVFGQDEEEEQTLPKTTMAIEENEYYFGKIAQGDTIVHDFKIRNTGVNPLVIYGAKGSCPCLTITWLSDTIMPNGTSLIHSIYDSNTKLGPQVKQITVYGNIEELGIMYVKGEVFLPTDSALINYDRVAEMKKLEETERHYQNKLDSFLMAQKVETKNNLIQRNETWLEMLKSGINSTFVPDLTTVGFSAKNYNAGIVNESEVIEHRFIFTNFGSDVLYILKVETNSDRAFADYPVDGIEPGESGEIVVKYDTLGMVGKMKLVIKISSNTFPLESEIILNAKIKSRK